MPQSIATHSTQNTPRNLGAAGLLSTLIGTELRRLLTARKTLILLIVQLLPAIFALVYVLLKDIDGLTMFRNTVETVTLPFLLPLAALFYGGPVIVDEMEGRTLTYLTLRPVPKPVLFFGKLIAGTISALALVIVPLLLLFIVCLATSSDLADAAGTLGALVAACALGVVTYTSVFAMLGVVFASSLLAGIVYFVVSEMVLSLLPVLELLSVRYYLRTIAGFTATDRLGILDRMVLDEPIKFEWWVGVVVTLIVIALTTTIGAYVFRERQYHV